MTDPFVPADLEQLPVQRLTFGMAMIAGIVSRSLGEAKTAECLRRIADELERLARKAAS